MYLPSNLPHYLWTMWEIKLGLTLTFLFLPQQISESRNRISSSHKSQLPKQAAERVSCTAVASKINEREHF